MWYLQKFFNQSQDSSSSKVEKSHNIQIWWSKKMKRGYFMLLSHQKPFQHTSKVPHHSAFSKVDKPQNIQTEWSKKMKREYFIILSHQKPFQKRFHCVGFSLQRQHKRIFSYKRPEVLFFPCEMLLHPVMRQIFVYLLKVVWLTRIFRGCTQNITNVVVFQNFYNHI